MKDRRWTDGDLMDFHNYIFRHEDKNKAMGDYLDEWIGVEKVNSVATEIVCAISYRVKSLGNSGFDNLIHNAEALPLLQRAVTVELKKLLGYE